MQKISFFDQLEVLLEVSKTSKMFIIVLIFLVFLAYMSFTTNKKNVKTGKKIYFAIYTFIFLFIIIAYHSSLGKMFDYMMNNLFIIIYFPNLAIYLAAIIATNVILCISVFNFKISRLIKNINVIVYCIMHYILALLLSIITNEKLDVFTQKSIYENEQAQALIELSSSIFISWIIFLILYKLIRIYQTKDKIVEPVRKIQPEKKRVKLPENIKKVKAPKYVHAQPQIIKNNTKTTPVITNNFDDLLTLDDYKILLKILKEQKEKELQEKERQARIDREQSKYKELQELYKI